MSSGDWLARYQGGEQVEVWAEMTALGEAVRSAEHAESALAVARETMRRARANLEVIVERLDGLGYQFWDGVQGPRRGPPRSLDFGGTRLEAASTEALLGAMFDHARQLAPGQLTGVMLEQLHNIYRLVAWPWQDTMTLARGVRHPADAEVVALYERAKTTPPAEVAQRMLPDLERLSGAAIEQLRAAWQAREVENPPAPPVDHRRDKKVLSPPRKKDLAVLGRLQKRGFQVPLALEAWLAEVGAANLAGSHPELCFWEGPGFPGVHADPLMIGVDADEIDQLARERDPFDVVVGWNARSKARLTVEDVELDFGYTVSLPSAAADPDLSGLGAPTTLVAYLRNAFRWGGFPGWEGQPARPDDLIRTLTDGLAPL